MSPSADRLSGAFCFLFGLAMYFAVIPVFVEPADDGNIAPDTMPNVLSLVIAAGGACLVVKPTGHAVQKLEHFVRAAAYCVVLGGGIYVMSWVGFLYVAPPLALAIMIMIGERRPLWLGLGVAGMPALIWAFVTLILDRPLP